MMMNVSCVRVTSNDFKAKTVSLDKACTNEATNNAVLPFCLRELVLEVRVALDITHGLLETSG